MSPVNTTFNLSPAISNVILAGNDSVPVMAPPAAASATACSIARCEPMPTIFKNFRMLRFSASSFIRDSRFGIGRLQSRLVSALGFRRRGSAPPTQQRPDAVQLAVGNAQALPEPHAARSAARLYPELLHARREQLGAMPGARQRVVPRMP